MKLMVDGQKRLIVLYTFPPKIKNGSCGKIRPFRIVGLAQNNPFSHESPSSKQEDTFLVLTLNCGLTPGSAILHWDRSRDNLPSVILTADSIMPVLNGTVSVMWSYPNFIGLGPDDMLSVWKKVKDVDFDWIYGGWYFVPVIKNGKSAILKSLQQITEIMTKSKSHAIFAETI